MFEWSFNDRRFFIREAQSDAEFHAVEEIQRVVWGFDDLDIVPAAHLVAAQWAGGMVLIAFEENNMIGFVYGFPAHEHGRISIHSHMLAVRPEYRNLQIGFYLKLAQRKQALESGIDEATWTFDPLQSLNAHLNFAKLGVISRRYIVNFYGEATSSPLHQGFGTDRLWVRWPLNSDRVTRRVNPSLQLSEQAPMKAQPLSLDLLASSALVQSKNDQPQVADFTNCLSNQLAVIEVPFDISRLKERDPLAAIAWREATRAAFNAAIEANFTIEDFLRIEAEEGPRWLYLLRK